MAMAHYRLGRTRQAAHCLAQANRWIDEANSPKTKDLSETTPEWGGWYDPITSGLLLRETEQMLAGETKSASQEH
jgi:hypothetical protein